jgi:hypothetical protein
MDGLVYSARIIDMAKKSAEAEIDTGAEADTNTKDRKGT